MLMLVCSALMLDAAVAAAPSPPLPLKPWVDYAKQLYGASDLPCPPARACVQLQTLEVRGRAERGDITLTASGRNFAAEPRTVTLVGPSSTFAVRRSRFIEGRGDVQLADGGWVAHVSPGPWKLEVDVGFEPEAALSLQVANDFASVVDALAGGRLAFDESSPRHGGTLFLEAERAKGAARMPVSIRASRLFKYASVTTFVYHFTVTGLREQTRLRLPLVGGEAVETVAPDLPYSPSPDALVVSLGPGTSGIDVTGHLAAAPAVIAKPPALPFEQWLFDFDPRHPVELSTDGVEIDPAEVSEIAAGPRARAFFLTGAQQLAILALDVHVDRGRQGAAVATLDYEQGNGEHWLASLQLTASSAPDGDRVAIRTPVPPHYAEHAGRAIRMFTDDKTLSVRATSDTGQLAPIGVQWREAVPVNSVLFVTHLSLPEQALHLDDEKVTLSLLPGYVALAVLGANHSEGDLVNGLHIYALLLAALAVALGRAARLPRAALALVGVLFVGLYAVEGFPRTALLLLLAASAVVVLLPDRSLAALVSHRRLHGFVVLVWVVVLVGALVPSVLYVKDRLLSALHPWAAASSVAGSQDRFAELILNESSSALNAPQAQVAQSFRQDDAEQREEQPGGGDGYGAQQQNAAPNLKKVRKQVELKSKAYAGLETQKRKERALAAEKTVRPVPFDRAQLAGSTVSYSFNSVLQGERATARVLVSGPLLRGAWMLGECAGLAALIGLMVLRARRLWRRLDARPEVQS